MEERQLADELRGMAQTAVTDTSIDDATLILMLRFIGKVAMVVDQAFGDVYAPLLELRYLKPEQLQEPARTELLKELNGVLERSRYRDVEEICSRLHHLSENYATMIAPRLRDLARDSRWSQVFWLLDEHEGRIINMVHGRIYQLCRAVEQAGLGDVPTIRQQATEASDELREALRKPQDLRNQILGLSGEAGLLELVEADRRPDAIAASRGNSLST
jgi:hypothetical protein